MSKKVEVIIGDYPNQVSLDLNEDTVSIALQYSIDDVRSIEKVDSSHSKTINLPGTKKNNKAFGNLFDVNSTFEMYDPNKKVNARIVVDSSPVLEGVIKLNAVNKESKSTLQGDLISYEAIVFDNSIDFIQTLGDKEVRDLNFDNKVNGSIVTLNHVYGESAITNAWNNHTFADVYQYPIMDKNASYYFTEDFKPAFYHKAILKRIFEEAGADYDSDNILVPNTGYNLEGSFLDNLDYEKEIISWDGHTPTLLDIQAIQREFSAGLTGGVSSLQSVTHSKIQYIQDIIDQKLFDFDDITTSPFFDNTSLYTFNVNSAGELCSVFTASNTGKYDFTTQIRAGINYNGNGDTYNTSGAVTPQLNLVGFLFVNDVYHSSSSQYIADIENLSGVSKTASDDVVNFFPSVSLQQGDEVKVSFGLSSSTSFGWFDTSGGTFVTSNVSIEYFISDTLSNGETSSLKNTAVREYHVVHGDTVEVNRYLPKEIKQKDIITDLIKRYNLYIRKHPTKSKTLILETRDNYYKNSSVLDWTQKKDYNSKDSTQFLSELQNKEIIFSYKEGKDIEDSQLRKQNELYTKGTGDLYGQKKISFDNDFAKGTKKIQSIFTSVPLINGEFNPIITPAIGVEEKKRKPSLLYWGGMLPVHKLDSKTQPDLWVKWFDKNSPVVNFAPITAYSTYPYAGHLDNPINPTLDIHFGEITHEFYTPAKAVENNLFNKYWFNYINQISNGKLITSKFYLNETDINFIKDNLNARIFIKDSYYNINKVIDYKPLEGGLTTVELLKINNGVDHVSAPATSSNSLINPIIAPVVQNNSSNNILSPQALTLGYFNNIGANSSAMVVGNNNNVANNVLNASINGNNNTISAGANNVTIVGDNITVDTSNTTVIGSTIYQNGQIINSPEGVKVTLDIGAWNMDASSSATIVHGLSATEWLTVKDVSTTIIDDLSSALFNFTDYDTCEAFVTAGILVLTYTTSTKFDSVDFDDATMNRGTITFTYKPD